MTLTRRPRRCITSANALPDGHADSPDAYDLRPTVHPTLTATPPDAEKNRGRKSEKEGTFEVLVLVSAANMRVRNCALLSALLFCLAVRVAGHEHHDELTEEDTNKPVDMILWIHIFVQAAVWGILFPTGMVLGMTKSKWHVPLQVRDDGFSLCL